MDSFSQMHTNIQAPQWPHERSPSKRHSTAWQERAQRRFSLTKPSIRAVTPDGGGFEESSLGRPLSSGLYFTASVPHSPVSRPIGTTGSMLYTKPRSASSSSPSIPGNPSDAPVRRRTKTLEEQPQPAQLQQSPPKLPHVIAFAKSAATHSLHRPKPSRSVSEESGLGGVSTFAPAAPAPQRLSADRGRRKLRRNRHRLVITPPSVDPAPSSDAAIIKVGKLMYWDNLTSPNAISKTKKPVGSRRTKVWPQQWRRVSGVLRENGELKLFDASDVTLLSVIQLSQLSRCGVQRLHASVLDETFCIAIYPEYAVSLTALVPPRPVYISVESRILFEAWLVLLRAFTIPELYGPDKNTDDVALGTVHSAAEDFASPTVDMFRLERSVSIRIIEARLRPPRPRTTPERSSPYSGSTSAREEPVMGNYFSEVVMAGTTIGRTMPRNNTSNPFWREDIEFLDLPRGFSDRFILLLKKERFRGSESKGAPLSFKDVIRGCPDVATCGKVSIDFDQACHSRAIETAHKIMDDEQEVIGEMLLRVRVEEVVVLMLHEYMPLSKILHDFSSGLTSGISRMIPTKLQRLSEALVNIFQVSGRLDTWLMGLANDDIDGIYNTAAASKARSISQAGSRASHEDLSEREQGIGRSVAADVSLLFRANSLLTRSLDLHMSRIGREYLEDTIGEILRNVDHDDLECEVDPSRITSIGELANNWRTLVRYFRLIWKAISESTSRCPRDMRLVLCHIQTQAETRFGDLHHTVRYSSVSGFLFLRFFCPAIINPKLFGLLKDHPQPRAQRTLTLIAKSLQGLANMATFGSKETWMEPMNKYLVVHRQEFREFIDSICSVSSEQQHTHSQQTSSPSYATPITILSRLPPTHREGIPSLPYLIDEARNYASLVNLWLDCAPDMKEIQKAGGDVLRFHEMCIRLRQRTKECVAKAEQQARPPPNSPAFPPTVEGDIVSNDAGDGETGSKSSSKKRPLPISSFSESMLGLSTATSNKTYVNTTSTASTLSITASNAQDTPTNEGPDNDRNDSVRSLKATVAALREPEARSATPISKEGAKQRINELVNGFRRKPR